MSRRRRTRALLLVGLSCLFFVPGCSTRVIFSEVSEDSSYFWFGLRPRHPKRLFSPDDEKVVLTARLSPRLNAAARRYVLEWIAPDDSIFLRNEVKARFASNEVLVVELPVAGGEVARRPGLWGVRLSYEGKSLLEHHFVIRGEWPEAEDCLSRPEVNTYLERIQERLRETWRRPKREDNVMFWLSVSAQGELEAAAPLDADNRESREAALAGLQSASPFGAPPPEATCLVGRGFLAAFTSGPPL